MVLQEGKPGFQYQVRQIDLPIQLERRLESLGLMEGAEVTVLQKKRRGAMIVTVRGTRFAMGLDILNHITVTERRDLRGA